MYPRNDTLRKLNYLVHLVPLTVPLEASQLMPALPELLHLRWLVSFTASTDALRCSSSLLMSLFDHFHTWTDCNVVSFYLFVYCAASPAAFLHRDHLGISFSCRSETKALPLGVAQGLRYQLFERLCNTNKCEDNETGYCMFVRGDEHSLLVYKHNCPCRPSSVCLVCYNSLIWIDAS